MVAKTFSNFVTRQAGSKFHCGRKLTFVPTPTLEESKYVIQTNKQQTTHSNYVPLNMKIVGSVIILHSYDTEPAECGTSHSGWEVAKSRSGEFFAGDFGSFNSIGPFLNESQLSGTVSSRHF